MDDACIVLRYYHFIGGKWSYPLLFHMNRGERYSFEDFIYISNRKISRSVLAYVLKQAVELRLIEKKGTTYMLTALGSQIKADFKKTKQRILAHHDVNCTECASNCLIDKTRASAVH